MKIAESENLKEYITPRQAAVILSEDIREIFDKLKEGESALMCHDLNSLKNGTMMEHMVRVGRKNGKMVQWFEEEDELGFYCGFNREKYEIDNKGIIRRKKDEYLRD